MVLEWIIRRGRGRLAESLRHLFFYFIFLFGSTFCWVGFIFTLYLLGFAIFVYYK